LSSSTGNSKIKNIFNAFWDAIFRSLFWSVN
jgi:hypothetical protein